MRACFSSNAALRCCSAAALASSAAAMRASALDLISSFFLAVSSACRHTANQCQGTQHAKYCSSVFQEASLLGGIKPGPIFGAS